MDLSRKLPLAPRVLYFFVYVYLCIRLAVLQVPGRGLCLGLVLVVP